VPGAHDAEQWWLLPAADGRPLACARLRRAIGLRQPRHWYHVGCVVHAAPELGLFHRLHTLQLGNDHTGASELADIAWDSEALDLPAQASALQALLQQLLGHVAAARAHYAPQLIVELPGPRDAAGQSPFWQGLGRFFYGGDPLAAARRFGPAWRSHVAALMPRQPVYTAFLADPARAAIAQTPASHRVLVDALWQAGLRYGHHIAIDDGGPVFEGALDMLIAALPGVPAAEGGGAAGGRAQ
jgi:arginine N-succinyltransferase